MSKAPVKVQQKSKLSLKTVIPGLVILGVAAIGAFIITQSHAATIGSAGFMDFTTANLNPLVFTTSDAVSGLGSQTVIDVAPGGQFSFQNFIGKLAISETCYYARAFSGPKAVTPVTSVSVQFASQNSKRTVSLHVDDNYHRVCVSAGSNSQPDFNVKNLNIDNGYVLLYQAINIYN